MRKILIITILLLAVDAYSQNKPVAFDRSTSYFNTITNATATGTNAITVLNLNTLTVNTTLTTAGRIRNTTRITANYTNAVTDDVIFCDTDGGVITNTLPAGVEGQMFKVINVGTNEVTIDGNGAETVFGDLTQTLSNGEILDLIYNATEGWW